MDKADALRRLEKLRIRTRSLDVIELCDVLSTLVTQKPAETPAKPQRKRGRPPLFDRAMTAAERVRRYRARQKAAASPRTA